MLTREKENVMKVMKILNENNENKYAKALHEVEKFMMEKEVSIESQGTHLIIRILDREFLLKSSNNFPRMYEDYDTHLMISE